MRFRAEEHERVIAKTVEGLALDLVDFRRNTKSVRAEIRAQGLEAYRNRSMVVGKSIILGRYDDPELRSISFFHEVGHIIRAGNYAEEVAYNTMIIEAECWQIGLRYAYLHGLRYSDDALKWAYEQVLTHYERPTGSWQYRYGFRPVRVPARRKGRRS